jgi:hypothetical protein
MRAVIDAAHLCFAATVTPEGLPNVSPKGTIGVWDETRLFFLDIASPGTRANLAQNPVMEINVVEQLSRRGYRFAGRAVWCDAESTEYAEAVRRVYGGAPPASAPAGVVLLTVERAAPLFSPAYWRGNDEEAIRAQWRERRRTLDATFEAYVHRVGPARVDVTE